VRNIKKIKAGDRSEYPFNHAFTDQERLVFQLIEQARAAMTALKADLARTPVHACAPPENYEPAKLEEIATIERGLDDLDRRLRWIPGGAYRYE
jgi:hypothetical protein